MKTTKATWRWLLLPWLLGGPAARAHDPFLSFTDVYLRTDEMEVDCSFARFTAARLLLENPAAAMAPPVLSEGSIDGYVPALKKVGQNLFEVTAGGKTLAPREVDVELNEEGDGVDFTIIYPRPPAGPLRFAAVYVKRLPDDGYGTALTVFDSDQQVVGSDDNLDMENLALSVQAPPPMAKPAVAAAGQSVPGASPLPR